MVSGSTLIRRQYAKTFLETFGPIWAPQQQPPVDPATLFSTSPSNNVSSRRDFWKPLAAYMIQSRKDYITVEKRPLLSASTAIANLTDAFAAFERMTGGKVDESIRTECYAYVRRTCPDQPREKPVATPRDLHLFVSEGVFSPRVVYRSSRERIQAALLPLLVSYGPARPSEAVLGNDQVEALRYEHVDYLLLYAPDCTPPFIPTTDVKLEHLKGARLKKGS